ncbi:ABC transporter permease [Roseisolibacter agri]|uniref:ABC transporter permease n=1 Tax=Roseisolibacter agri TaxID=2014610 RepID=UPI0024E17EC9|nr:ABC transporter permease [Roseisolibacter agri]
MITPEGATTVSVAVREIHEHRDLLLQLAQRDVRVRYKQAAMGFAWAILTPLLVIGAGTLLRLAVASMAGVQLDRSEVGSLALKAFPWAFFAGAIGFAVQSITGNLTLVTKVYFPRAVLPLGSVLAQLFDLAIGCLALVLLLPFLGAQLTPALLWAPLLLVLLVCLTAGVGVFLACANLFFRDVKYITQVMLTFGVFFTPVLFDATAFGARGVRPLMMNPLSPLFEGLRLSIMEGHNLLEPLTVLAKAGPVVAWEPWFLAYSAAWSIGGLLFALVLFQRTQFLFAEYV